MSLPFGIKGLDLVSDILLAVRVPTITTFLDATKWLDLFNTGKYGARLTLKATLRVGDVQHRALSRHHKHLVTQNRRQIIVETCRQSVIEEAKGYQTEGPRFNLLQHLS